MQEQQKSAIAPLSVFISYAHEDQDLLKELEKHLSLLQRQMIITIWYDRQIVPGTDWSQEIDQRLSTASLILLLISPDFLASDYCYGIELQRALELHTAQRSHVIPILLRPVDWEKAPFAYLSFLPHDTKPVTEWADQDAAFRDIAQGIRLVAEQLCLSSPLSRPLPLPQFPSVSGLPEQSVAPPIPLNLNRELVPSHPTRERLGGIKQLLSWLIPISLALMLIIGLAAEFNLIMPGNIFNAIHLFATHNLLLHLDVLMGLFVVIFVLYRAKKLHSESVELAQQRQKQALGKLRLMIKKRLFNDEMRLTRARSIRSLAFNIQQEIRSPVINDVLIAEVIRSLAIEIEENYRGKEQVRLLQRLNAILDELEPGKSPLLSIAITDPLTAYRLSWPGGIFITLLVIITLIQLFLNWTLLGIALWIIFFFCLAIAFSALRTRSYWKASVTENQQQDGFFASLISPKELNPVLDFLSFIAITSSASFQHRWSIFVSPIWETPYLMPGNTSSFLKMHEYRYFEAQPLMERLTKLQNSMFQSQQKGQELPGTDWDDYISLCRELWIITGEEKYKTLMRKAREGVLWEVDLANKKITPSNSQMARFKKLHRDLLLVELGQKEMPADDIEEYISLCNELREISGSERYRDFEKKAKQLQKHTPRF